MSWSRCPSERSEGHDLRGRRHIACAHRASACRRRDAVPVLAGTLELLAAGIAPGGTHRNLEYLVESVSWDASLTDEDRLLLCDAQTSGGLLLSTPAEKLDELIDRLRANGVTEHAVVGEIVEGKRGAIHVTA